MAGSRPCPAAVSGLPAQVRVRKCIRLRGASTRSLVGMGTAQADDPLLTARPTAQRIATRVVFCRRRLPRADSQLIESASAVPVMLVTAPSVDAAGLDSLRRAGRRRDHLSHRRSGGNGSATRFVNLGDRGMTNVMLEGGGELLASFFAAGQIDELHVYIGAKAFGGRSAAGPIGGTGVSEVEDALARTASVDGPI